VVNDKHSDALVVVFMVTPQTPVTGTTNETTLAMGASVPTTKAEPVAAGGGGVLATLLLPQPVANKAAAVNETNALVKCLPCVLKFMSDASLFLLKLLFVTNGLVWGRLAQNGDRAEKRAAVPVLPFSWPCRHNSLRKVDRSRRFISDFLGPLFRLCYGEGKQKRRVPVLPGLDRFVRPFFALEFAWNHAQPHCQPGKRNTPAETLPPRPA
jgi:hypothetical protein